MSSELPQPYTPEEVAAIGFDGNFDPWRACATAYKMENEQRKRHGLPPLAISLSDWLAAIEK